MKTDKRERKGAIFIPLACQGVCNTLIEALNSAELFLWQAGQPGAWKRFNTVWVYDGDHMITLYDRHQKRGRIEPISSAGVLAGAS